MRNNQEAAIVGSHRTKPSAACRERKCNGTGRTSQTDRTSDRDEDSASSLDFGCEAEIMRLADGGGRTEPQRNRGQNAARSDAEASREKLLQRTHELRREPERDHPHGFASA